MTSAPSGAPLTCPSARAEPGNLLYGRVVDGRIERLGTPLAVDAGFVAAVAANGPPEQRFRFAGACQEGRCAQWTGTGCGVIDRVLDELAPSGPAPLPRCAFRSSCRWFAQSGPTACPACTLVVTDRRQPVAASLA